ncbi:hypothetical protein [Pseudomonas urmiensis]|uniref:hypothetical protein n=1 Tax=Pseudomonas urmiensis TaxID=2745493 RepID=UPI003D119900
MNKINLHIELSEQQARHFLLWLDSQFNLTMADVWYSDRYRNVPTGERAPKVLADVPHLSGISRARKALEHQLAVTATERAQ